MKISLIRQVIRWGLPVISAYLLWACNSDRQTAETTAQAFLQAYYIDLDFDKAKSLCTDASQSAINEQAMIIGLNPYAQEEVPDLVIRGIEINSDNSMVAICSYTCNRVERVLPLHRLNGIWLVDLGGSTVESAGSRNNFTTLSQDGSNGFASSASGEIKYKKRHQDNK